MRLLGRPGIGGGGGAAGLIPALDDVHGGLVPGGHRVVLRAAEAVGAEFPPEDAGKPRF